MHSRSAFGAGPVKGAASGVFVGGNSFGAPFGAPDGVGVFIVSGKRGTTDTAG